MMTGRRTKLHSNFKIEYDENGKARVAKGESKKTSVSLRIKRSRSKRVTVKKRVP